MQIADSRAEALSPRYRLLNQLGRGGFGTVHRAEQVALKRLVAIKTIHKEWVAAEPEVIPRFKREAQAAARIRHPHAIEVHDFDQAPDGTLFLVMELLEGESLAARLARGGRLPVADAILIAQQTLSALAAAHAAGIVHRDVKPENIFLLKRPDGAPPFAKVLDFGLARIREGSGSVNTAAGDFIGTPAYAAPEQCLGREVDERIDIYAMGAVLFEMLAGRPPFLSSSPIGYATQHVNLPAPALVEVAPDLTVPPHIQAAVLRALAKEPAKRFASADAFRLALDAPPLTASQGADKGSAAPPRPHLPDAPDTRKVPAFVAGRHAAVGGNLALGGPRDRVETPTTRRRPSEDPQLTPPPAPDAAKSAAAVAPPPPSHAASSHEPAIAAAAGAPAPAPRAGPRGLTLFAGAAALMALVGVAAGLWWEARPDRVRATPETGGAGGSPRVSQALFGFSAAARMTGWIVSGEAVFGADLEAPTSLAVAASGRGRATIPLHRESARIEGRIAPLMDDADGGVLVECEGDACVGLLVQRLDRLLVTVRRGAHGSLDGEALGSITGVSQGGVRFAIEIEKRKLAFEVGGEVIARTVLDRDVRGLSLLVRGAAVQFSDLKASYEP